MFFSKIYKSWKGIQEEKYDKMLEGFDKNELSKAFSGRVIDVGSGTGLFEEYLKKNKFNVSKWVCVDPDVEMIKQSGFSRVLGDGNHLPFKQKSFDNLICLDSIHLIRKDFFWVLKPGGHALVSIFCNPDNMEEKKKHLRERMKAFTDFEELFLRGKENEILILAKKR